MTTANRGKVAEALVKKRLDGLAKSSNFAYYRPPDMRAGVRQVALSDFLYMRDGHLTLLEVKSVQHDYRLPHANFSPDQVARMRLWEAAGADTQVLIYHSELKVWRSLPASYFAVREGGSWDLRAIPTATLETLLC